MLGTARVAARTASRTLTAEEKAAATARAIAAAEAFEVKRRYAFDTASSLNLRASEMEYSSGKFQGGYSLPKIPFNDEAMGSADSTFFDIVNRPNMLPGVAAFSALMTAIEHTTEDAYWALSNAIGKSMGLTTAQGGFSLPSGRDQGRFGSSCDEVFVKKVKDIVKEGGLNRLINGAPISEVFGPAAAAAEARLQQLEEQERARAATPQNKYKADMLAWQQKALADAAVGIRPATPPRTPVGVRPISITATLTKINNLIDKFRAAEAARLEAEAAAAAAAEIERARAQAAAADVAAAQSVAVDGRTAEAPTFKNILNTGSGGPAQAAAAAAQSVADAAAAAAAATTTTEALPTSGPRAPPLFGGRKPRRISRKKRARRNKTKGRK